MQCVKRFQMLEIAPTIWRRIRQHRAEAARRAHNPKVGGSNPPVAIITTPQVIEKYLEESNSEG